MSLNTPNPWFTALAIGIFILGLMLFFHCFDFGRRGNKLVVAVDQQRHVVCYRFAHHDGIYCFKTK